jgi:cyclopropane-fatty-acyl-phospholipid synthase
VTGRTLDKRLEATRTLLTGIGKAYHLGLPVVLWDGSEVMLGPERRHPTLKLHLRDAGALSSLLRRPRLDTILKLHAMGAIDLSGGTLLDLAPLRPRIKPKAVAKAIGLGRLARLAAPLLLGKGVDAGSRFDGAGRPLARTGGADAGADVRFHYDLSNDFYRLFLDERMVYTCAYFAEEHGDLDRAQADKLEMICRKLRLAEGDRLLDIGCGWGALLIHAAKHHGAIGHGVTLSPAQRDLALERIAAEGLSGQITIDLKPYEELAGPYDKIASIGMFEHVGFPRHEQYFSSVARLLKPGGLYLHHAITRRGKRDEKAFRRKKPEYQAMTEYIFPGGEVDHIGHSAAMLEEHGFEVHDVEGWRTHYARTTALWCRRLEARRTEAEALVGPERTRIWLAYLGGVSLGFARGSISIFQTLTSKRRREGHNLTDNVPLSRGDLYR